jgi:hypothetical protein
MAKTHKPGETADRSGLYGIRGPRGGETGDERTVVEGKPFPPTPRAGQTYVLDQPAHHRKK